MDLPSSLTVIGEAVGCRSCRARHHDITVARRPNVVVLGFYNKYTVCIEGLQSLVFS